MNYRGMVLTGVLFLALLRGYSQGTFNKPDSILRMSITAGLNMAVNNNIDSLKTERTYLPFAGLNLSRNFGSHWLLGGGLYYSLKGSNINSITQNYRFHYADLKLYTAYQPGGFIRITAGVQPSYLLKAVYKKADDAKNITAAYDKLEISFPVGIELLLQENFHIGFRYHIPNPYSHYDCFEAYLTIIPGDIFSKDKDNSRKKSAYRQIMDLKEGSLYVKLQTGESKLNRLLKEGNTEAAIEYKKLVDSTNTIIIKAFRNKYNFSQVAFYTDIDFDTVSGTNYHIVLINDSLKTETSIIPYTTKIFFADFGGLETGEKTITIDKNGNEKVSYSGTGNSNIAVLRILDKAFVQLEEPFPFFVRLNEFASRRSYEEVVGILNNRLNSFYLKAASDSQ